MVGLKPYGFYHSVTSGPMKYEVGLHSNKIYLKKGLLVVLCVCAKGCMQRTVWMNQIIHRSMLCMIRQTQYVEGVLNGVDPVCIRGSVCKDGLG